MDERPRNNWKAAQLVALVAFPLALLLLAAEILSPGLVDTLWAWWLVICLLGLPVYWMGSAVRTLWRM